MAEILIWITFGLFVVIQIVDWLYAKYLKFIRHWVITETFLIVLPLLIFQVSCFLYVHLSD